MVVDSDSDNFQSLKKVSKPKQNGKSKPTKPDAEVPLPGAKVGKKSPIKPSSTQSKTAVKSPVTPKSVKPPQPKQTPTSLVDYFGSAAIQRSDKKLVASTKRKAVSNDGLSSVLQILSVFIKIMFITWTTHTGLLSLASLQYQIRILLLAH